MKYTLIIKEPFTTNKFIVVSDIVCDKFMTTGEVITLFDSQDGVIAVIPIHNISGVVANDLKIIELK